MNHPKLRPLTEKQILAKAAKLKKQTAAWNYARNHPPPAPKRGAKPTKRVFRDTDVLPGARKRVYDYFGKGTILTGRRLAKYQWEQAQLLAREDRAREWALKNPVVENLEKEP